MLPLPFFHNFWLGRDAGDVRRIHGIDERVATQDFLRGVQFFIRVLRVAAFESS
jgi:hypothetical protein